MKLSFLFLTFFLLFASCSSSPEFLSPENNQLESDPSQRTTAPSIYDDPSSAIGSEQDNNLLDSQAGATFAGQIESSFIDPNQVKVIDSGQVEWSDSCLGIDQPGVECVPQVTKGYMVILEANGLQFEYHANQVGGQVMPATLGLVWTREGGKDQLCDRLIIYLPDTARACWCEEGEIKSTKINLQDILTLDEYTQLIDALRDYSANTYNQNSPDGSGPLMVSLTFNGQGNSLPQSMDQQELLALAERIFTRINP
jgi:hypothetical protein